MTHNPKSRRTFRKLWLDRKGQDLIEYALITATMVVFTAGFFPNTIVPTISTIFSRITCTLGSSVAS